MNGNNGKRTCCSNNINHNNNGNDNESNYKSSTNSASVSIKLVRSCIYFKYSSAASRDTNRNVDASKNTNEKINTNTKQRLD